MSVVAVWFSWASVGLSTALLIVSIRAWLRAKEMWRFVHGRTALGVPLYVTDIASSKAPS